jgi:hypothetical protein
MKLPHMKSPCPDCPMAKDCLKGWLGSERMEEILTAGTFVCHKRNDLQCAGHMLMRGEDNEFVELAGRFKMELPLTGQERVFDTMAECIKHHRRM